MKNNIRLLYAHNFLTDFRPHAAFLIIYIAQIAGSYTQAMGILALETVVAALMDIPSGALSDRFGRKAVIALGSLFTAAAMAAYAFATDASLLFTGAVLSGLGSCFFSGNNDALLYETLKESGREKQFHHVQGRASSMFQVALTLSAVLASFLADSGLRLIFIIGIVPQVLAFLVSLFFREPRVHIEQKEKSLSVLKKAWVYFYRNPKLRLLVLAQAISWGAGESKFQFQVAFFNTLLPLWALGVLRALNHVLGFFGFWFSGPIIERLGAPVVPFIRGVYWVVSQSIGLLISNVFTPFLFHTGAFLFGPGQVAAAKIMQEEFTDAQRATMGSIASFMGSIFYALAAVAIGSIADNFGAKAGVALGMGLTALSLPFYWQFHRKLSKAD